MIRLPAKEKRGRQRNKITLLKQFSSELNLIPDEATPNMVSFIIVKNMGESNRTSMSRIINTVKKDDDISSVFEEAPIPSKFRLQLHGQAQAKNKKKESDVRSLSN